MPIYPTLYENNEGKIVRGPDLGALHWTIAMDELHELVKAGELPVNVAMVGEYEVFPPTLDIKGDHEYILMAFPWPLDLPLNWMHGAWGSLTK